MIRALILCAPLVFGGCRKSMNEEIQKVMKNDLLNPGECAVWKDVKYDGIRVPYELKLCRE